MQTKLRALLAIIGGLASILVLETGALFNAVNMVSSRPVPKPLIYVFGSLLAVGVGVVYLPAFCAQQRCGERIIDSLCRLPPVDDDQFMNACEKRAKLKSILGLDASFTGNLESGLVLLTPLIGSVFTTFVR
jgi:H+/Cl- antiporter ClcA